MNPFLPDCTRAEALQAAMRRRFAESLDYLADFFRSASNDAVLPEAERWQRWTDLRVPPFVCATYFDLIFAIEKEEWESANRLFFLIADSPAADREMGFRFFEDPDHDPVSSAYLRYNDSEPERPLGMIAASPEQRHAALEHYREALAILGRCDEELDREVRELVSEIFFAGVPADETGWFDGVSSFELLGGVAVNAAHATSRLHAFETLVHEACHQLLFGLSHRELMVRNSREDRFASPLRNDPRPMEGIYHATVVLARMIYGLDAAIADPAWTDSERNLMRANRADYLRRFHDGVKVVRSHADMNRDGWEILEGAEAFLLHPAAATG